MRWSEIIPVFISGSFREDKSHSLYHPERVHCVEDHVSPVLGGPELGTVLQIWPHQDRVEGESHLSWPADHILFNASQDTTGPVGHKG